MANAMKKVVVNLYGEGLRIDVLNSDEDVINCYNAMVNDAYFDIEVDGKNYSYDDFGEGIEDCEWPDDIDDDEVYKPFVDNEPGEVFSFERCDSPAETEGAASIQIVQTKVSASVTIEICEDEEFDPKKLHFLLNEFSYPDPKYPDNPRIARYQLVNCSVIYNGKQYDIELDIDSEREISVETVWQA